MNAFLISTRQNNVRIFGKRCLRQSDNRINRHKRRNREKSKLDHCEGGSFSPTIFDSEWYWIKCFPHFVFYICVPRLSLCRRQRMPKNRTLFRLVDIKKAFIFNLLCVLIWLRLKPMPKRSSPTRLIPCRQCKSSTDTTSLTGIHRPESIHGGIPQSCLSDLNWWKPWGDPVWLVGL